MSANAETIFSKPSDLLSRVGISAASDFYKFRTLVNLLTREELDALENYVPQLLSFYQSELDSINPASSRFLTKDQKKTRLEKLKLTYFLLYAQYQLDSRYGRQYNLHKYKKSMDACAQLIDDLTIRLDDDKSSFQQQHDIEQAYSEKYLKFCGRHVGEWLAKRLAEFYGINAIDDEKANENKDDYETATGAFADLEKAQAAKVAQGDFARGNTAFIKKWMGAVNERRLYWVWGGGMLNSVLDLLSDDFLNKQQTQGAINSPAPFTGYMSWLLYYARFALNMSLVLKHTFIGPWMTAEERAAAEKTTAWQRFYSEIKARKFALLNDSIWATANLLCFFWLKGPGWLGWGGNVATGILLAMDLILNVIRYFEEETAHNKHIQMLKDTIESLEQNPEENKERIAELQKAMAKAQFDWKYKRYGTINDIAYSAGLLAAFALVCCAFAPPGLIAASTLMIVAAAGAALCFALTVIYAAVTSGIEIAKMKATAKQLKLEYNDCFKQFEACKTQYEQLLKIHPLNLSSEDLENIDRLERELHIHYLTLKDLEADVDYQNRMARFQSVKLVRSIFIDACIPALIFASFTFMPLPIALAVLGAGLLLAGLSYILINQFEPKPAEKAMLAKNESDYLTFLDNPVNPFEETTTAKASKAGLFSQAGSNKKTDEESSLIDTEPLLNNGEDSPDLITFD